MRISARVRILAATSAVALALTIGAAHAQTAGAAESNAEAATAPDPAGQQAQDASHVQGEEIVVYGRRRSERTVDAPLAITALSPESLAEQSIVSFTDLTRVAPNVVLRPSNSGGGTVNIVIRGQSIAQANIANDSPIGIYYDDVIISQPKGVAAGLFDTSSIEVARGVQGTLRGRNNTGGSISIYTKRPVLGEYGGEGGFTYGSRNYVQAQGVVNLPVGDKLALRFGAQKIRQDGQGESVTTGQEFGGRDQSILRASALFEPSASTSLFATYERIDIDQSVGVRRALPGSLTYNALLSGTRNAQNPSGLQQTADQIIPPSYWDSSAGYLVPNDRAKIDFVRGTLTHKFSDALTFKLIGGYRELVSSGGIDLDGTAAQGLESVNGGSSKQFTIEPQLSGEFAGGRLRYLLGYYHFSDKGSLIADTYAFAANAASPTVPFRNHIIIREGAHNVSDAGYAHLEWKPIDRLEIAGGIRYTRDKREVMPNRVLENSNPQGSTYGLFQAGTIGPVGCLFTSPQNGVLRPAGGFVLLGGNAVASGACPDVTLKADYDYWSYEATARYEIANNLNAYVRTGLGQKSGGINIPIQSTITAPFDPEEVRDYEVGLKGARIGGVLDFSVALYHSDYEGLQRYISTLLPGGGGIASAVINAGSARVRGIEADANLHLGGFQIGGFLGYTDAKYREFTTTDAAGNSVDLSSQPFVATPKFTSRLNASYETPFAGGTIKVGGGWAHQSNASLQAIAFPGAETGVVDLFDARISWTSEDDHLELALYGTNLGNEKYLTDAGVNRAGVSTLPSSVTAAYGVPGERRFIGGSLSFRFGH